MLLHYQSRASSPNSTCQLTLKRHNHWNLFPVVQDVRTREGKGSFGPCHRKPVMAYSLDCHMLPKITRAGVDGALPLLSQSPLVSKPGEVGQTRAWLCPELPWCCPTAMSSLRIRIRPSPPPRARTGGQSLGFHPVFHLWRPFISNGSTGSAASVLVGKSLSIIWSAFYLNPFLSSTLTAVGQTRSIRHTYIHCQISAE